MEAPHSHQREHNLRFRWTVQGNVKWFIFFVLSDHSEVAKTVHCYICTISYRSFGMQRAGTSLPWRRSVSYSSRLRSRRAAELSSELCHWSINDIVKLTRQSAVRTVYKLSFCWKSPIIVEICSFKSLILPLNSMLPTEIQERKARGRAPAAALCCWRQTNRASSRCRVGFLYGKGCVCISFLVPYCFGMVGWSGSNRRQSVSWSPASVL
jgi:hypothetical protein